MGHTDAHLEQRIQGYILLLCDSFAGNSTIPELPLTIGTSRLAMAFPIMGPPARILPVSSGNPPAASINAETGVPILTLKLAGCCIDFPVTVTTLSNRGLFFCTAS